MKSLKARLLALLAMVTMLLTVSGSAMAQDWGEPEFECWRVPWDWTWDAIECSDGSIWWELNDWADDDEGLSWPGGGAPWTWDDDEEEEE